MPFTGDDHNLPAGSIIPNGTASDAVTQHNAPLTDISDALSTLAARVTGKRAILTATATPEEFGGTDATAFQAAIDYLEAAGGGTLLLGNDRYQHPFTGVYASDPTIMDIANITILGSGRPTYNSTFSTLEGGTILDGSFFFAADNFAMFDLGIDSGSDYCTMNNGGVPVEGINGIDRDNANVTGFVGADPTKYNCTLDNIAILCHKTGKAGDDSDVHALLLENYKGWRVSNIVSVKGGAGLVIKSSHGSMYNAFVRGSYKYGVLNKSEAYSDASFNTFDQIIAENLGDVDPDITVSADYDQGVAFRVEAANADARHVIATNVIGNGCVDGIQFYALNGHIVDNCHVIGAQLRKIDGYAAIMNVYASNGTVQNSTMEGVKVNEGSYGFYMLDNTDTCGFINCQARDVTYYSFGNGGTANRIVSCSSDTPFSGHIVTTGGDLTVIGGLHRIGTATLHQNSGGTLSGLTYEGMVASKGAELFTNGDGESTTGWTFNGATGAIVAGGVTGNCFQSTRTGAPAGYSYQFFDVVVGQRYKVAVSQKNGTGTTRLYLGTTLANGTYTGGTFVAMNNAAWTAYEYNFVASSTSLFVTFQHASAAPGTFLIDDVSVKAVPITADGDIYAGGKVISAGTYQGTLAVYANNAAAVAGGLDVGQMYRTGADPDPVCIVH